MVILIVIVSSLFLSGVSQAARLPGSDDCQADPLKSDVPSHNMSADDLSRIVADNKAWVESKGQRGTPANLNHANLRFANLTDQFLEGIDFTGSDLTCSELRGADLEGATLVDAILTKASLTGAHLSGADLEGATLVDAILTKAVLVGADLSGTDLCGAKLDQTNFTFANLKGANFEPRTEWDIASLALTENLEIAKYTDTLGPLAKLRKDFSDDGYLDQVRKVTYAIRRRDAALLKARCMDNPNDADFKIASMLFPNEQRWLACFRYTVNVVFFDFAAKYGLNPVRPLGLLTLLWLGCAPIYYLFIHFGKTSGLYKKSTDSDDAQQKLVKIGAHVPVKARSYPAVRELRLFGTALFFSLIASFDFGYGELSPGQWLRRLTRRPYTVKVQGWARVVAGWQSLLSMYLVVLAFLSYFGHPFER